MLRHWRRYGILAVVILLILCSRERASGTPLHNFHCSECHLAGLSVTQLGSGNVCLKCHSPTASDVTLNAGAPPLLDGHTDGRFISGDASNAFGHGTGQPAADQTSHNWAVTSDALAAAGAQPPAPGTYPQFYSRYGTSTGKLTCTRCHNPHAVVESNPKLLVLGANSADTMCRACHLPWDQTDNHGLLTHPMVTDYSAKAAAAPDKYRPALVNKDNADIRLVDGGVSCTSCHGVHFTDSDAATVDASTLLLSQSDGKLLRGDGPKQDDRSSLCQTCHIYSNHGDETGEQPGCLVCHGGHSYDPDYPNYFVLRKRATTATYNTVTGLDYSSPDVLDELQKYTFWNDGTDGTANGYCEKCHGDARDIGLGAGGYHVASAICTDCHKHGSELGAFSASCGACHGNSATQEAWPDGIANNDETAYAWSDDAGSHVLHVAAIGTSNASCATCHPGNPPKGHLNDDTTGFQQAEVTRMDATGDGIADYWRFAGGALSGSGAPVYIKDETGNNDSDAYYRMADNTCANINCHGGVALQWGASGCLSCHAVAQGNRTAVVGQFATNSHHVQGTALTAGHCYQCHWEANNDGTINPAYHGGVFHRGSAIDLVVYGAGTRPLGYSAGVTAIQYTADGSRAEIAKLNGHCLGCHSDPNNATTPFGDGKTPKQYAWDGTSVSSRYSQTGTTGFGKYSGAANTAKKIQTKAYSAHGKATLNQGGWSPTTGLDDVLPDTRAGAENVACYDCHNSHGSSVAGRTTSYNSATLSGGLIKDTQIGSGGYSVSYQPVAGGQVSDKNQRNPGASLCMDCHMNATSGSSQPWGYQSTFGATAKIMGYYDTAYYSPGYSGTEERYPYRKTTPNSGGHFGASSALGSTPMGSINGLCTPCHDPHGVSPSLGTNQQYGVPLLKGTWITSPYKEDVPPAFNSGSTASPDYGEGPHYNIDQNTFGSNVNQLVVGITQTDAQFAGLCLGCHPKTSLTKSGASTPNAWKSKDRVHESVKGWKTSPGTVKHNYSCSKCHSPHTSSTLPRLMTTNCLDWTHKGRVAAPTTSAPVTSDSYEECGSGSGRIPGVYSYDSCEYGVRNFSTSCHETKNGHARSDTDQSWNLVTPWEPTLTMDTPVASNFVKSIAAGYLNADIKWNTNMLSSTAVDYGLTTSYGQTTTPSSSMLTAHKGVLTYLTNHQTYHYQARSSSYRGQQATSGDLTFYISYPPDIPALVKGDEICLSNCPVTLSWTAAYDVDGGPVAYNVEIDDVSNFASPESSGWRSATNWTTSPLQTGKTWYWRIQTRDANHIEATSAWSASSSFKTLDSNPVPGVPVLTDEPNLPCSGACPVNLEWSTVPNPFPALYGAVQYYLEVDDDSGFASINANSGWITATNATVGPLETDKTWFFRVRTRYTANPGSSSAWSTAKSFQTFFAPTKNITFTWTDVPSNSISINGTLYGGPGTGSVNISVASWFKAEIVGSPGQVGGGEPDPDWEYCTGQAPGGNPGYISAIFTPDEGSSFSIKVGTVGVYRATGGYGGGASYVAKDNSTSMYAAAAGGGGGGEATWFNEDIWDDDEGWYGDPGEGFGSATGGSGGLGSWQWIGSGGDGCAGQPGGDGGSGSSGVTPTTMTGNIYIPRVTITIN